MQRKKERHHVGNRAADILFCCKTRIPMPFVLEFSRETGCSVPRQDLCGLQVALYYLSLFLLASIPKGNLFVGVSPACRCRSTNERVVYILAEILAIWTNNVFPSFPERMRFELSLEEVFPILFCRSKHIFVHIRKFYSISLWHTLASFVVRPNIVEGARLAKRTLCPKSSTNSNKMQLLHFGRRKYLQGFSIWKNKDLVVPNPCLSSPCFYPPIPFLFLYGRNRCFVSSFPSFLPTLSSFRTFSKKIVSFPCLQ